MPFDSQGLWSRRNLGSGACVTVALCGFLLKVLFAPLSLVAGSLHYPTL